MHRIRNRAAPVALRAQAKIQNLVRHGGPEHIGRLEIAVHDSRSCRRRAPRTLDARPGLRSGIPRAKSSSDQFVERAASR